MCEVIKCMHHRKPNRCEQGSKMVCQRRYKKLHLKVGFVEMVEAVQHGI